MKIIDYLKAFLIGSAILTLMTEKKQYKALPIPKLNPYYYKIKKLEEKGEVKIKW